MDRYTKHKPVLMDLLGSRLLHSLLLDLLGLLNLANLEGSSGSGSIGLDELADCEGRLQIALDEGAELGYIDLVVGGDVLLDDGQGRFLPILVGDDVPRDHLGLLGLDLEFEEEQD